MRNGGGGTEQCCEGEQNADSGTLSECIHISWASMRLRDSRGVVGKEVKHANIMGILIKSSRTKHLDHIFSVTGSPFNSKSCTDGLGTD